MIFSRSIVTAEFNVHYNIPYNMETISLIFFMEPYELLHTVMFIARGNACVNNIYMCPQIEGHTFNAYVLVTVSEHSVLTLI